jgi:hypothetical protein
MTTENFDEKKEESLQKDLDAYGPECRKEFERWATVLSRVLPELINDDDLGTDGLVFLDDSDPVVRLAFKMYEESIG